MRRRTRTNGATAHLTACRTVPPEAPWIEADTRPDSCARTTARQRGRHPGPLTTLPRRLCAAPIHQYRSGPPHPESLSAFFRCRTPTPHRRDPPDGSGRRPSRPRHRHRACCTRPKATWPIAASTPCRSKPSATAAPTRTMLKHGRSISPAALSRWPSDPTNGPPDTRAC